jgi:hypothetical protein
MATVGQNRLARARGEQALRQGWEAMRRRSSSGLSRTLVFLTAYPFLAQGLYYLLSGLWPLINMHSFVAVTGPKTDLWLVRTVGVLVCVIGAALCLSSYRKSRPPELIVVALGSAVGLIAIDVYYVLHRTISPIYLLDAVIQGGLIALWVSLWRQARRPVQPAVSTPAVAVVPSPPAAMPATAGSPPPAATVLPH